jgi:zinc protease
VNKFLERTRAVTAKDIQRAARQYLIDDARTVGILIPLPPRNQAAAVSMNPGAER